jgi:hypothetical protein
MVLSSDAKFEHTPTACIDLHQWGIVSRDVVMQLSLNGLRRRLRSPAFTRSQSPPVSVQCGGDINASHAFHAHRRQRVRTLRGPNQRGPGPCLGGIAPGSIARSRPRSGSAAKPSSRSGRRPRRSASRPRRADRTATTTCEIRIAAESVSSASPACRAARAFAASGSIAALATWNNKVLSANQWRCVSVYIAQKRWPCWRTLWDALTRDALR